MPPLGDMSAQDAFVHVPSDGQYLVPSDVPAELWMEIALELDALDVLSLSQVCFISEVCAIVAYRSLPLNRHASLFMLLYRGGNLGLNSFAPYVSDTGY
jgi:hypothetical protein